MARYLDADEVPPRASELGAASLLVALAAAGGDDARKPLDALREWAVDAMMHRWRAAAAAAAARWAPAPGCWPAAGDGAGLALTHGALVKGSSRPARRWADATTRLGHLVWLCAVAAADAVEGEGELGVVEAVRAL